METPCRLSLLGAAVDVVTADDVLDFVSSRARAGRSGLIVNHNLHSLYLMPRVADLRTLYDRADLIEIDSTLLIAWARLMGQDVGRHNRCTYLDWRDAFWTRAEKEGWRVAHIGGRPEDGPRAREAILKRRPRAQLDVFSGYFDMDGAGNEALLLDLHVAGPQVLLVGMGMPRQEQWVWKNIDRLPPCVVLTVGGAFDYEAGRQYEPPRWSGQLGLEWLMRFLHDPRRLFGRYFVEPWGLLPAIAQDAGRRLSGKSFLLERNTLDFAMAVDTEAGAPIPVAALARRRA